MVHTKDFILQWLRSFLSLGNVHGMHLRFRPKKTIHRPLFEMFVGVEVIPGHCSGPRYCVHHRSTCLDSAKLFVSEDLGLLD